MPLQVSASLCRKGGVFLAGEQIECNVTFSNFRDKDIPTCHTETLAWASCQIHCQQILNEQKVRLPSPTAKLQPVDVPGGQTSLVPNKGEIGVCIFSSKPVILFCDLSLNENESKTFSYMAALPRDGIPPSFKGQVVKYIYKLTVAAQRHGSSIKLLRIPIRIFVLEGISTMCIDDTQNHAAVTNPFLHHHTNQAALLPSPTFADEADCSFTELANEVIESVTSSKNAGVYNVVLDKGKIGTFTLFRSCFKLGDEVTGCFDFSDCDVRCVQYCVTLQCQEEIAEACYAKSNKSVFTSSYCKDHAFCVDFLQSHVRLTIPLWVTHTFYNSVVSVNWKLHFEFVVSNDKRPASVKQSDGSYVYTSPAEINIKTLVWDLPIKVYPCSAMFACISSSGTNVDGKECKIRTMEYLNTFLSSRASLVNEIDEQGQVVHLTDLKTQSRVRCEADSPTTALTDLETLVGVDVVSKLQKLVENDSCDSSNNTVDIDCTSMDKAERTKLHNFLRTSFPEKLDSNTAKHGELTLIKVSLAKGSGRKRKIWPAEYGGDFCQFVIYKENIDTQNAISLIVKFLGSCSAARTSVSYAGLKDKRARTTQLATAFRVEDYRLSALNKKLHNIRLGNFRYVKSPLKLGSLKGNRFTLVIREASQDKDAVTASLGHWKETGFLNYYGSQRFGVTEVPTHVIGKAILSENWSEAIDLILKERQSGDPAMLECYKVWTETKNARKALEAIPPRKRSTCIEAMLLKGIIAKGGRDYVGALRFVPHNLRLLYLHSYTSYLWNRLVSKRIQKYGTAVLAGDLVLCRFSDDSESVELGLDPTFPFEETSSADDIIESDPNSKPCSLQPTLLSEADVADCTEKWNVVMPIPGHSILLPKNEIAKWYEEMLAEDGLTLDSFRHKVKEYSAKGDYRHVFCRATEVEHSFARYNDNTLALTLSDLDLLEGKTEPETVSGGKFNALKIAFNLPASSYATVALRELMKIDTSAHAQLALSRNSVKNNDTD